MDGKRKYPTIDDFQSVEDTDNPFMKDDEE
jgi:hypothetical protein